MEFVPIDLNADRQRDIVIHRSDIMLRKLLRNCEKQRNLEQIQKTETENCKYKCTWTVSAAVQLYYVHHRLAG